LKIVVEGIEKPRDEIAKRREMIIDVAMGHGDERVLVVPIKYNFQTGRDIGPGQE